MEGHYLLPGCLYVQKTPGPSLNFNSRPIRFHQIFVAFYQKVITLYQYFVTRITRSVISLFQTVQGGLLV